MALVDPGNAGMEKLIPTVNKLHDICAQMGTTLEFDLPQIAVIGSQSAGKSSVLENFVGRDFLPRGSGIVTRRPLILQLINNKEEYGEFRHCMDGNKSKKFNIDDICAEIEAETDRETGTNKGISNKPINLRIYSPKVLDLTLVDLPGITKVPVGDQPYDIETQIRNMILEFIQKENCLILAVSPANCDLANSDALKLAKEVDEAGLRTIGVITKLDLMDEGTDAREIFQGKLLPLRRGYIGVVNRSQKDIDSKKDIAATLEAEHTFFKNHYYYQHIVDRLGTPFLQKTLNIQLKEHIGKKMRMLLDTTRKQMVSLEKEICNYKHLHPDEPSKVKAVMLELIQQLQKNFEKEMGSLGSNDIHTDRFSHGSKIRRIFHECLPNEIAKIQYDEDELRREIVYAIENLYGINGVLNTPFKAFEVLVKKQIQDLEQPINMCIELVIKELSNAIRSCTQRISSHPKFRDFVENKIMTFINDNSHSKQSNILSLVKMESSYMNSMHYEFKYDKQSGIGVKLEQITAIYDDLSKEQRKVLAHRTAEYMNNEALTIKNGNEVKREGTLYLENDENCDKSAYWCVLKLNSMTFSDFPDDSEVHLTFQLSGLKFIFKKEDGNFATSKSTIILYKSDGSNIHPDYKNVKVSSTSSTDICLWANALAGVIELDDMNRFDPLEKDVDLAYDQITSYMRIIKKTMCDMVPKAITLFIIRESEKFIQTDLLIILLDILTDKNLNLFGAEEEDIQKYMKMTKMYETCKSALKIMMEC